MTLEYIVRSGAEEIEEDREFWRGVFQSMVGGLGVRRMWTVPTPHYLFGYAPFVRVRSVVLRRRRQRGLVAAMDLPAMCLFAVPQATWRLPHDADVQPSYQYNPFWYANERGSYGDYNLGLFEFQGFIYVATIRPVAAGERMYLYYGDDVEGCNWRRYRPSAEDRFLLDEMLHVVSGWPLPHVARRLTNLVETGFDFSYEVIE